MIDAVAEIQDVRNIIVNMEYMPVNLKPLKRFPKRNLFSVYFPKPSVH